MDWSILLNYGILGVWTTYLLWEKSKMTEGFINNLKQNTQVLGELAIIVNSIKEDVVDQKRRRK